MIEVKGFLAMDGKFFKTETECLIYEKHKIPIRFFGTNESEDNYEECGFAIVNDSQKAEDYLRDNDLYYDGIDGNGVYFFNGYEEWEKIPDDTVKALLARYNELMEILYY